MYLGDVFSTFVIMFPRCMYLDDFGIFWPKSKWREIKIGYLAAFLKWYNILFFFQNYDFL